MTECIMCGDYWDSRYNCPDPMDLDLLKAIYEHRGYPFPSVDDGCSLVICQNCITAPVHYCVDCHETHPGQWVYLFITNHVYDRENDTSLTKDMLINQINTILADRGHKHKTNRTDSLCYDCMKPHLSKSVVTSIDWVINNKISFD